MNTAALRRHQLPSRDSTNLVGGGILCYSIVLTAASSHQSSKQSGDTVSIPLVLFSADSGSAGSVSPALSFMEPKEQRSIPLFRYSYVPIHGAGAGTDYSFNFL